MKLGCLVLNLTFKTSIAGYFTADIINGLTDDNTFYCSFFLLPPLFAVAFPSGLNVVQQIALGKSI